MSKSCWQPSHFHMAMFPPRAVRLWRMVVHAWAVIISHTGVSSGFPSRPCCRLAMSRLGLSVKVEVWVKQHLHPGSFLTGARGNQTGTHSLPRDSRASASLGTVHRNSLPHRLAYTHSLSSVSLTLTAATTTDADAAEAELHPALLILDFTGKLFLCALGCFCFFYLRLHNVE